MIEGAVPSALTLEREKAARAEALRTDVVRQVGNLIGRGYAEILGVSESAYRERLALPTGIERPEAYRTRFPYPLIVDPRVSLEQLSKYVGPGRYHAWVDPEPVEAYEDFDGGPAEELDYPYLAWVNFGRAYRSDALPRARAKFAADEVGGSTLEGVTLYMQYAGDKSFLNGERGIILGGIRGYCCDLDRKEGGSPVSVVPSSREFYSLTLYAYSNIMNSPNFDKAGILTRGKDVVYLGYPKPKDSTTPAVYPDLVDDFKQYSRNGRWGTCVECPRDQGQQQAFSESCAETTRYDHRLNFDALMEQNNSRLRALQERAGSLVQV